MHEDAKKFNEYSVGDEAEFDEIITADLVERFRELSGDKNPLHFDETYAKGTALGRPIAHGMIAGMLFSRLVGMYLPGPRALYMSQQLDFRTPMYFGTALTVHGKIIQKVDALRMVRLATRIIEKETNRLLVGGEAVVQLLE